MGFSADSIPALLGGEPLRPEGPPDWPPDDPAVRDVLHRAAAERWWGKYHGPHGEALALQLSRRHGGAETLLCSSGTVAVELALRGMKVGPGDEVILAAYDFRGNFQDVLAVGATPVLVDIHADHWNFDPQWLERAWSPATKAILVSHLHGGVVEMPAVMEFARAKGVPVIEDACQMPGAAVHGRVAGLWGDAAILSFGGSKLLSAGRGGAVVSADADLMQRIRLYTQRGNEAYPLSELQAAILSPQVENLEAANAQRIRSAAWLIDRLRTSHPGVRPFRNASPDSAPGYYKLGLQYDPRQFGGLPRDLFARAVRAEGVALDPGFRALHATHSRRRFRAVSSLENATEADRRVLTLHHPVLLEDEASLAVVLEAIERVRTHAERILAAFPSC